LVKFLAIRNTCRYIAEQRAFMTGKKRRSEVSESPVELDSVVLSVDTGKVLVSMVSLVPVEGSVGIEVVP